jgi:hypothetical protein
MAGRVAAPLFVGGACLESPNPTEPPPEFVPRPPGGINFTNNPTPHIDVTDAPKTFWQKVGSVASILGQVTKAIGQSMVDFTFIVIIPQKMIDHDPFGSDRRHVM